MSSQGNGPWVKTIVESSQVKLGSFFSFADRGGMPKRSLSLGSSQVVYCLQEVGEFPEGNADTGRQ